MILENMIETLIAEYKNADTVEYQYHVLDQLKRCGVSKYDLEHLVGQEKRAF